MSSLLLRTVTDGGTETNDSGLALLLASFLNSVVDGIEIAVSVIHVKDLPTV